MDLNINANPNTCSLNCLHGNCILDIDEFPSCRCSEGFGGLLCDKVAEICPDSKTICLNGSKCRMSDKDYHCDCSIPSSAIDGGGVIVYAGAQCGYSADSFCEYGVSSSTSAFCTNGGICKEILVDSNKNFKGCKCPDKYTGKHCEYLLSDLENPWYYTVTSTTKSSNNKSEGTLRGFVIFVVVSIALILLFVVKKVVQRSLKARKVRKHQIQFAADRDLHLDPDGDILPQPAMQENYGEHDADDQEVGNGNHGAKYMDQQEKEETFIHEEELEDVKKKKAFAKEENNVDQPEDFDSPLMVATNHSSDSFEEEKIV